VLEEVGLLAAAGLQKGDILTGVDELHTGQYASFKDSAQHILKWLFESQDLAITFSRKGVAFIGEMENPKSK
jgi:type II secretory pathway component PulC